MDFLWLRADHEKASDCLVLPVQGSLQPNDFLGSQVDSLHPSAADFAVVDVLGYADFFLEPTDEMPHSMPYRGQVIQVD